MNDIQRSIEKQIAETFHALTAGGFDPSTQTHTRSHLLSSLLAMILLDAMEEARRPRPAWGSRPARRGALTEGEK